MRRQCGVLLALFAAVFTRSVCAGKVDPETRWAMAQKDDSAPAHLLLTLRNVPQEAVPGAVITFKGTITNNGTSLLNLSDWGVLFPAGGKENAAKPSCRWQKSAERFIYASPMAAPMTLSPGESYAGAFFSEILDPKTPPGVCKGTIVLYGGIGANSAGVRVATEFSITILEAAAEKLTIDKLSSVETTAYYTMPVHHYAHDFIQSLTEAP